jgi:hypothetical protein
MFLYVFSNSIEYFFNENIIIYNIENIHRKTPDDYKDEAKQAAEHAARIKEALDKLNANIENQKV